MSNQEFQQGVQGLRLKRNPLCLPVYAKVVEEAEDPGLGNNGEAVTEPLLGDRTRWGEGCQSKIAVTTPFKVALKGTVQKDPSGTTKSVQVVASCR